MKDKGNDKATGDGLAEKSIKEEMEENSGISVTINLRTLVWTSIKPMNSSSLRSSLTMFCEILLFNDIMNTVDANYMKRLGLKKKMGMM